MLAANVWILYTYATTHIYAYVYLVNIGCVILCIHT